jgi:hypothetical protein
MRATFVIGAALAVVAMGGVGVGCGEATPGPDEHVASVTDAIRSADLAVVYDAGDSDLSCPEPTYACFDVSTNGANITHIFVDVDAPCVNDPSDFYVEVDGHRVDKLHTHGGPCHGIDRDVWFPLTGNQDEAEVCVYFNGFVPERVSVGAKSKSECVDASTTQSCTVCETSTTTSTGGGGAPPCGCTTSSTTSSTMGVGGAGGAGGAPCDNVPQ